jgi:aldose 1-epimerase
MGILRSALSAVSALVPQAARADKPAVIEVETVGTAPDGTELIQYTLTQENGLQARFLNYGAALTALVLPDGTNVVARLPKPEDYLENPAFIGSTIGPIANRLKDGSFELNGKTYHIAPNDGRNVLHGGAQGYHTQYWQGQVEDDVDGPYLRLSLFSEDRKRGYPSDCWAHLEIRLTASTLRIDMCAQVTTNSYINMTTHPYFNPTGKFDQPINDLILWCEGMPIAVDTEGLPDVGQDADPSLRLIDHKPIGERVIDNHYEVYATRPHEDRSIPSLLATLTDHERYIYIHSDAPGLQIFTADTLPDIPGIIPRGAVALEPQSLPNHVSVHTDGTVHGRASQLTDFNRPFRRTIAYRIAGPGLPELPG